MTRVMGILNTTPDSFSDGGSWEDHESALRHAVYMAESGADIIDVGGESTRPGAIEVPVQEELDRVVPVVESVLLETDVTVSVDTSKPQVMEAAVQAGARMVNDVFALRREGALETAAKLGAAVCLMHMLGNPGDMQDNPQYEDVVGDVLKFLQERARACEAAGIPAADIVIDPGFGFGKTLEHNLALFRSIPRFCGTGYQVLVGVSRKSMLGSITGRAVDKRVSASVAAAVLAAQSGADIVRVHDVAETVDALKIAHALTG